MTSEFSSETNPPELWLTWNPSNDETDSQALILYETYLNGVLVPDGGDGTNTIAYCRDVGPRTVVLRAVDTSGNRSGPSNELNITCWRHGTPQSGLPAHSSTAGTPLRKAVRLAHTDPFY